ncbi:hypothetical protein HDA39_003906 [Kribbella italica]|uniref:Uncharacterized protein n=1 Tax=Kribbella italica TaxID=1540520 RepID=A0A7W9J7Q8_9ACTN|nr:hypothetical protein [Kribbella italica]
MYGEESHRPRILSAIRARAVPLDDDQLSAVTGIQPRQAVNQICRRLATEAVISRGIGAGGKLVSCIAQPTDDEPQAVDGPLIALGALATVGPTAADVERRRRAVKRLGMWHRRCGPGVRGSSGRLRA